MDLNIKGRRALLLAASGGLGYSSALALAKEGVNVVISSSDLERAKKAAESIKKETGASAVGLLGDLSVPTNMDNLFSEAKSALGGNIDILLNNHGGPPFRSAAEVAAEDLTDQFNKMVLSQIRMIQNCLPAMREQDWGRIFMVGASAVVQPKPNNVLSNLFRSGMANYFKTLADEVIKDGVTINVVSPTTVLTERTRSTAKIVAEKKGISFDAELENRQKNLPSGRFGDPQEFGQLVAFLAGDMGGYYTGSNWRVDGGMVKSL